MLIWEERGCSLNNNQRSKNVGGKQNVIWHTHTKTMTDLRENNFVPKSMSYSDSFKVIQQKKPTKNGGEKKNPLRRK